MKLSDVTNDFLNHCRTKGLSSHTVRAYSQDLKDFDSWARRAEVKHPITKAGISQWVVDLRHRGLAPTTIKRRLACAKVLCRWLENDERIATNPCNSIQLRIPLPKRLPRHLTDAELRKLLKRRSNGHFLDPDFTQATLEVALELLFTTGVRIAELCAIRIRDIDFQSGVVVIKGKGNRERRVFLVDDRMINLVSEYISRRDQIFSPADTLLINRQGSPATPEYIRKILHQHREKRSLDRIVTPHMFRHTAATQLLKHGVDIRFVQKLLGHASISTTEQYTYVSDNSLQDAIRRANPRRKFE